MISRVSLRRFSIHTCVWFAALLAPQLAGAAPAAVSQVETIVLIRHGEKPPGGLGMLNVIGLNRSLALPKVLLSKYGKPAYIFAPDPGADLIPEGPLLADGKHKENVSYVRPLLTIGPTAIKCGMPINATIGFRHIDALEHELDKPRYRNAVVFVAWEHLMAQKFMRNVVRDHGGNPAVVPVWTGKDYDSIYLARILRDGKGGVAVNFRLDHEGLNGFPAVFPKPAPR